jgi:hypothetical protein
MLFLRTGRQIGDEVVLLSCGGEDFAVARVDDEDFGGLSAAVNAEQKISHNGSRLVFGNRNRNSRVRRMRKVFRVPGLNGLNKLNELNRLGLTGVGRCHSLVKRRMRRKVTVETLKQFMDELAAAARSPGKVYFTGGATALLLGFRDQTIDVDIKLDPEPEGVFEAIARLKNQLDLNVELASPDDFIPVTTDWKKNSPLVASVGRVEFFHFDLTFPALAKLERGN